MSKLVEVKMTKATLYLTEEELQKLLINEPEIWAKAIKRGKWEKRRKRAGGGDVNGCGDQAERTCFYRREDRIR